MRCRRTTREVDAHLFDGSSASAAEISARFSGSVSHHGDQIEVAVLGGRVFAGAGCWVVRDRKTRALSVVEDRHFAAQYEALDLL